MLGNASAPNVLEQIAAFAAGRIAMHTQVVLCPGVNDGPHLATTLEELARFHPWVRTVALVPVGLTQYREKLPVLTSPDRAYARSLLAWAEPWRRRFRRTLGTRFAFPSDEFYLLAGRPFPGASTYEGYPQLGNGVGGSRKFLEEFRRLSRRLPAAIGGARAVTVVTGTLAIPVLAGAIQRLNAIGGLTVHLLPVRNSFFGGSVTCAGLLTGSDIVQALDRRREAIGDAILLPAVAFKDDEDVFLDDLRLADLGARFAVPAVRVEATARRLAAAAVGPGGAPDSLASPAP
jgi:putative radical SAM enzyme (TIGR03279 family)